MPPKIVLVPPYIERDVRFRSRFSKPSYDYMFGKKQIKLLLSDFFGDGLQGALFFSPPADPDISSKGKIGLNRSKEHTPSESSSGCAPCPMVIIPLFLRLDGDTIPTVWAGAAAHVFGHQGQARPGEWMLCDCLPVTLLSR